MNSSIIQISCIYWCSRHTALCHSLPAGSRSSTVWALTRCSRCHLHREWRDTRQMLGCLCTVVAAAHRLCCTAHRLWVREDMALAPMVGASCGTSSLAKGLGLHACCCCRACNLLLDLTSPRQCFRQHSRGHTISSQMSWGSRHRIAGRQTPLRSDY